MHTYRSGFALPAVLISSVVLLLVLVTTVSATVAIRTGLREQRHSNMARLAGEAGTAYAIACLKQNNGTVTWSDDTPLRPNTDCTGDIIPSASEYVLEEGNIRTYFVVRTPSLTESVVGEGYVEVLRESTGTAWRVWEASVATATGGAASIIPPGTSIEGYWTSPPLGYLLEDGSAVSRTEYASLFAVIGTTFGNGNGSTTFNLPDSRGKGSIARNTSDASFNALGETGGSKTHTLTEAQLPTVDILSAGSSIQPRVTTGSYALGGSGAYQHILGDAGSSAERLQLKGGGQSHNILDPYIVVTRVIKY